jgi:Protein of unknown function (DUF2786)
MTINRDDLIDKIKALMSKTTVNGCTEPEALAALDKARALMDAYEVAEADLQLTKDEAAILRSEPPGSRDPHNIKFLLSRAVSEFCNCKAWKGPEGLQFCGLPADARLATWLLDTLAAFVQAELAQHLMGCVAPKGQRRFVINGFVSGCCKRISDRLEALCTQSASAATSNGRELVVLKNTAIADKMKAEGIALRTSRSCRRGDEASRRAGSAAGDRASFGRPVTGTNATLRLK